jgi:hypothetical protein
MRLSLACCVGSFPHSTVTENKLLKIFTQKKVHWNQSLAWNRRKLIRKVSCRMRTAVSQISSRVSMDAHACVRCGLVVWVWCAWLSASSICIMYVQPSQKKLDLQSCTFGYTNIYGELLLRSWNSDFKKAFDERAVSGRLDERATA